MVTGKASLHTLYLKVTTRFLSIRSCSFLPGHALVLQASVSLRSPVQFWPPLAGGGLSHDLVRDLCPPPHVAEHVPQTDQILNPPSTEAESTNMVNIDMCHYILIFWIGAVSYVFVLSEDYIRLIADVRELNMFMRRFTYIPIDDNKQSSNSGHYTSL